MPNDRNLEPRLQQELIEALRTESLAIHDSADIQLSSGRTSKYYVNVKDLLMLQSGREIIGKSLGQHLRNVDFAAVGGPEVGGLLAALAFADYSHYRFDRKMETFFVRKKAKGYGIRATQPTEHNRILRPGDRVVIVDDVVTSGASLLTALAGVKEMGFEVAKVVAVLDREEGGGQALVDEGYDYSYLVSIRDLIEESNVYRAEVAA